MRRKHCGPPADSSQGIAILVFLSAGQKASPSTNKPGQGPTHQPPSPNQLAKIPMMDWTLSINKPTTNQQANNSQTDEPADKPPLSTNQGHPAIVTTNLIQSDSDWLRFR